MCPNESRAGCRGHPQQTYDCRSRVPIQIDRGLGAWRWRHATKPRCRGIASVEASVRDYFCGVYSFGDDSWTFPYPARIMTQRPGGHVRNKTGIKCNNSAVIAPRVLCKELEDRLLLR